MPQEIVGFGVDIVEIAEFDRMPFESNRGFYKRCFTDDEITYCQSRPVPAQHFAARFAAKEAAVKAASSFARLLAWHVEVRREDSGIPRLRFWDEECSGWRTELDGHRAIVSMSHSESLASAAVMICKEAV
jgi:holo-[acyl-carrier protein] synthase